MNDVERWLQSLGLGGYAQTFAEQGIEFDLLSELGDDDLKALGVGAASKFADTLVRER
jgi:hypothetical protein